MTANDDLQGLIDSVIRLNESISRLQRDTTAFKSEAIEGLAATTKALEAQAKLNASNIEKGRRRTRWLVVSVALDIILSVVLSLGWVAINDNNQDIAAIQSVTSDEVLCPLYNLILAAKDRPSPTLTPDQLAERVKQYAIIQSGYDALHCKAVR